MPCDHAFEPRYDEFTAGSVSKKVYVRDVCPKCGETVERDQPREAVTHLDPVVQVGPDARVDELRRAASIRPGKPVPPPARRI